MYFRVVRSDVEALRFICQGLEVRMTSVDQVDGELPIPGLKF
jgi:hypothetical protein